MIVLNHTTVPVRDKEASAHFFAQIFGLKYEGPDGYFCPIQVNDTLTFLFDQSEKFEIGHFAFHVSDAEFDAIFGRVKGAGLAYGSGPVSLTDGKINSWGGGRGVYFTDPNGHVLELMTVPQ